MSDSRYESVPSTSGFPSKKRQLNNASDSLCRLKQAVVVLTRLPEYKISALRPPTPQQFYSEDELSSSESDMQWTPEDDSSDSDFGVSDNKKTPAKSTPLPSTTARPQPVMPSTENKKTNNTDAVAPAVIISSAFAYSASETTKVRPDLPEEEVSLDMIVLARRKTQRWQRGKILEINAKEDGRLRCKIGFEEKGKSRVSGHHIAFNSTPRLEQLYVGARVVVRCQENKFMFRPAILAELPSRKNRLRFLVIMDDHTPAYVGLPFLHLVCRPLESALDDIPDGLHKSFMRKYLKDWPYPHLTQYNVGQTLNVEVDGEWKKCEVLVTDCSLMRVVFQENQHKEWLHRGSIRLEHIARFLEMKEAEERKNNS